MKPLSAKVIATLLTLALIALAACGGASEATEAPATANPAPTTQAQATPTFAFSDPANRITVPAATPTPLPEADMQATAEAEEAANYPRLRTPGPLAEATPEPAPDPTEPPFVVSISPAVDDALSGIYVQPDCLTHYRNMLVDWYWDGEPFYGIPETLDEIWLLEDLADRAYNEFGPDVAEELWEEFLEDRTDCISEGLTARFADDYVCHTGQMNGRSPGADIVRGNPDRFMFPLTKMRGDNELLTSQEIFLNFDRMPGYDAPGCWYYHGQNSIWYWRVADGEGTGDRGKNTFYAPVCDFLLRKEITDKILEGEDIAPEDVQEFRDNIRRNENFDECSTHTIPTAGYTAYFWNIHPSGSASAGCPVQEPTGVTSAGNYVVNWNPAEDPPGDGTVCWVRYSSTGQWKGYAADEAAVPLFDPRDYIEGWDDESTASP